MSETLLSFVPVDREYVPSATAIQIAIDWIRGFLPRSEQVEGAVSEHVQFIDCGENWCGVWCPHCGPDAEPWWTEEMTRSFAQTKFGNLSAVAPCCGARVSLD